MIEINKRKLNFNQVIFYDYKNKATFPDFTFE